MHSHLHIPLVFFRVNEQARLVHPLDKRNSCQLQMDESFYDSVYQIGEIVGIFTDQVTGMTIVGNVLQIWMQARRPCMNQAKDEHWDEIIGCPSMRARWG